MSGKHRLQEKWWLRPDTRFIAGMGDLYVAAKFKAGNEPHVATQNPRKVECGFPHEEGDSSDWS